MADSSSHPGGLAKLPRKRPAIGRGVSREPPILQNYTEMSLYIRYPLDTSAPSGIPLSLMHFAVVKITFEYDQDAPMPDRKDMSAMLEKIRARFRVVAMPASVAEEDGDTAIAYVSLAHSEESLNKQLDAIAAFCEESGFGRVADEAVLMDDIDTIGMVDEDFN